MGSGLLSRREIAYLEAMKVLYFAWLRAKIGLAEERVEPPAEVVDVSSLLQEADADAGDLAALDAAWEDVPVSFGPDNACKDGIVARVRGALRPAPGMPTYSSR